MMGAVGGAIANPTQVVENLPSSVVALASSLGGGSAKPMVPYGLAYKFVVKLAAFNDDSAADLGSWSKCTGLKMDFNPVAVKYGGDYRNTGYLPGPTTYPKITLQRAVEPKASAAVQKWLKRIAMDWVQPNKKLDPGGGTITLYGPTNEPVLTWHLVNVRPAAWSGPDLDANGGKIALETLELVHEGFQVTAGTDPGEASFVGLAMTDQNKNKMVKLTDENGRWIQFANSPVDMKVERTTESPTLNTAAPTAPQSGGGSGTGGTSGGGSDSPSATTTTPGATAITVGHQPNVTKLTLNDLYLVEKTGTTNVVSNVALLIEWMSNNTRGGGGTSGASAGGGGRGTGAKTAQHKLTLSWANFPKVTVYLSTVSATYVQFDTNGKPIRAKVTITVNVVAGSAPPLSNPTSGGIPNRKSHLLIHNENLALLADENYGSTARWRDIAEANDIDDPLRTGPGRRLFIPAPSELGL